MTPLRPARLASINRGAEQPRVAGGVHRLPLTLLLLAGTALVSAETAQAQAARGGDLPNPLLTFSFSSSLHVSDNYNLSEDPSGTTTYLDLSLIHI